MNMVEKALKEKGYNKAFALKIRPVMPEGLKIIRKNDGMEIA